MATEVIEYEHDSERWIDVEVREYETAVFVVDAWYVPSRHWHYFSTKEAALAFRDSKIAEWKA